MGMVAERGGRICNGVKPVKHFTHPPGRPRSNGTRPRHLSSLCAQRLSLSCLVIYVVFIVLLEIYVFCSFHRFAVTHWTEEYPWQSPNPFDHGPIYCFASQLSYSHKHPMNISILRYACLPAMSLNVVMEANSLRADRMASSLCPRGNVFRHWHKQPDQTPNAPGHTQSFFRISFRCTPSFLFPF